MPLKAGPLQAKSDPTDSSEVDLHVGKQIRLRRLLLGLTQDELARSVGLSQQRLHLHEKGARISASRLYAFARVLSVPIEFFFEGLASTESRPSIPQSKASTEEHADTRAEDMLHAAKDKRMSQDVLALIRAYRRIGDPKDRKAMLEFLKRFSPGDS